MSDVPNNTNGPTSTMFSLDPDLRNRIDGVLRDPEMGPVGVTYQRFQLEQRGVSRSAFYRYACKIRNQVDLEEAAARIAPVGPDGPDIGAILPQIIARRLLTILLDDEEASAATIHRLTLAYRAASNTYITLDDRKKKTPPADPKTESIRAQAFADIREYHERNKQEWAIRHNIAPDDITAIMTGARAASAPGAATAAPDSEISNLKSDSPNPPCKPNIAHPGLPINRSPDNEYGSKSANPLTSPVNPPSEISNIKSEINPAPVLRTEQEKKPPIPVAKTTGNHRPPSGRHPRTDPTARASIHDILNNRTRRREKKPNDRVHHHRGIRVEELTTNKTPP